MESSGCSSKHELMEIDISLDDKKQDRFWWFKIESQHAVVGVNVIKESESDWFFYVTAKQRQSITGGKSNQ